MKVAKELEGVLRNMDDLIVLPGNPRQGDIGAISVSLQRFGQLKPVVVNNDGVILAGNHTYLAAKALEWDQIAAVTADELEGAEQSAYALADNRLSDLASNDDTLLLEMAHHVADETGSLEGTGYDYDDLDFIEARLDETKFPEVEPETPTTEHKPESGDIWELEPHQQLGS